MTDTDPETERTATVLSQSIELALTHQPDAKNKYGSGRIRPERVVFYYLDDRINAHLWGVWVREDGEATDAPVDQLYRFDDNWPGWLTELANAHDPREKPSIAWTPDVLEAFWAAAKRANGAPATDPAAPELTAEEARDLADELGTELYRAQDALAFVEECCVIADREGHQPTTADVREWLKGARCGRQLLADARDRAALIDRIRRVLAQIDGFDFDSLEPHDYQIQAAALAAVLPAIGDRADVTETDGRPRRGDQFEAWLKAQRDGFGWQGANDRKLYDALDGLLNMYRLHADMGTPLDGHVCEARVIGDCECLEAPPAAGAPHPTEA